MLWIKNKNNRATLHQRLDPIITKAKALYTEYILSLPGMQGQRKDKNYEKAKNFRWIFYDVP